MKLFEITHKLDNKEKNMPNPFTGERSKEDNEIPTYSVYITCTNCGADSNITIRKTVSVRDAVASMPCKNCECCCLEKSV